MPSLLEFFSADPARWTQRTLARNSEGEEVDPSDPTAVSYCLMGALRMLFPKVEERESVLNKLSSFTGIEPYSISFSIQSFNDDKKTTYEDVIYFLKKAGV